MFLALLDYRNGDKDAFKKAFTKRGEKINNREIYWVEKWDRIFHTIAVLNTQKFDKPFPNVQHR